MNLKFEPTNLEYRQEDWEHERGLISNFMAKLPEKPSWYCSTINDTARLAILAGMRLHKPKEEIYPLLRLMLESGIGMFTMLANPGKSVSFQVGEIKVETEGRTEVRDGNYPTWMSVVNTAIILRNGTAFKTLMEVPEKLLLEAPCPKGDDFNLKFFKYYRSLYHREIDQGQALIELYESTDPKKIKIQTVDFVLNFWVPIFDIHFAVLKKEEHEFNQKLSEAVLLRKAYQKEQGKKEGYENQDTASFSPSLIAAASYGSQCGLKMTVESDYLPLWMVEGDFPGWL